MEGFLGIMLAIVWMALLGVVLGIVGAIVTVFRIRRDQKTLIGQVEAVQKHLERLERTWRGAPAATTTPPSASAAATAATPTATTTPSPSTAPAAAAMAAAPPRPPPMPTPAAPAAAPPRPPPIPPSAAAAATAPLRPAPALTPPPPASPTPAVAMAAATEPAEPGALQRFEAAAMMVLRKAWNWLVVGEEYRDPRRSLEYSVATTWGIRLAIALIVTGIAFGLRLSFERGLIGPLGRVSLGVLTGIGMVGGGLVLLGRRYHIIGQGSIGGGLATLYLTAYAAHHLYQIVGAWGAFGCMALVTAAAGVISVSVPSLLTAILGIIGGYLTPFVLTGSTAGYGALFGYLIILGLGVLIVGHFRYWVLLNYLGMAFAYAHVFRALDRAPYHPEDLWQVLPPLALLFLLYTLVAIIHNLVRRRPATLIEALGLIVNSSLFFWLARDLITQSYPREAVAVLTVALAALYVGMVYVLLARRQNDRNLLLPLLALAGTYTALTMPLLLSREWLTTSWAVQAFVMLWLARRLGSRFLEGLAYLLYVIVVWRLFALDLRAAFPRLPGDLAWGAYARSLAERLVAFGVPIAALFGAWRLNAPGGSAAGLQAPPAPDDDGASAGRTPAALGVFLAVAVLAGFVYLQFEVHRFCGVMYLPLRPPALTFLWIVLAAGLLVAAAQARARGLLTVVFWTVVCLAIGKLVVVDLRVWGLSPERLSFSLTKGYSWAVAAMRALDFLLVVLFAAWAARRLSREGRPGAVVFAVMSLLVLFFYLTAEVNTLVQHYVPGLRAGGISVLWSVYALALVIAGIRRAQRPLRLAGLLLFAVVGLKVFFVDLGHLEPLYRMLALIAMGLITLGGTALYLRNAERFQPDTDEEKAS